MRHSPYAAEIRTIYQAALLIFTITVVIGILNGLDLVDFGTNAILTHVHAGTLGWLTLGVIATTLWVFSDDGGAPVGIGFTRALAWLAAISFVVYVIAFYSGNLPARAIGALPVLTTILLFLGWVWTALGRGPRSLPRVGIVVAIFMLLLGGTIGTLLQIQLATDTQIFPSDGDVVGGHAVAMVFSYLILFGMVVAEWRLVGGTPGHLPRGGIMQVSFLVLAGLVSIVALLFNLQPLLPITILLEVGAVVTFLVRLGGPIMRLPWGVASGARQFGASAIFIVIDIVLVIVTIAIFISVEGDIDRFPVGVIIATDHATFIGVMTNALFALLLTATQRDSGSRPLAQVTFWGLNIGLVGFIVGLLAEIQVLKQIFTPIMGISILVAIAVFVVELWRARSEPAAMA